eukprot:56135-Eustigmatos_ZCMA.PRE.1
MDGYGHKYMIDHVLVQVKHKWVVKDVRSVSAKYHTKSDHRMVRMKVDLGLMCVRRRRGAGRVTFDRAKCRDRDCMEMYRKDVDDLQYEARGSQPFDVRFESWREQLIS